MILPIIDARVSRDGLLELCAMLLRRLGGAVVIPRDEAVDLVLHRENHQVCWEYMPVTNEYRVWLEETK